jgi:hypothetical protein
MDEVTPILTPKKKKIKMPNQPPPPQKFVNFALTLRKIADHNFGITIHSFGKIVHRV